MQAVAVEHLYLLLGGAVFVGRQGVPRVEVGAVVRADGFVDGVGRGEHLDAFPDEGHRGHCAEGFLRACLGHHRVVPPAAAHHLEPGSLDLAEVGIAHGQVGRVGRDALPLSAPQGFLREELRGVLQRVVGAPLVGEVEAVHDAFAARELHHGLLGAALGNAHAGQQPADEKQHATPHRWDVRVGFPAGLSHFPSFFSRLYSFLVSRMNEPCCGPVTPSMSTGELKLRRYLSALQMR